MLFMDGKDRFYERFMQELPRTNKGKGNRKRTDHTDADFKYTFSDLDCRYCLYYKQCRFDICPEIMKNLDDIMGGDDFYYAVENAENCTTPQRQTLIALREYLE